MCLGNLDESKKSGSRQIIGSTNITEEAAMDLASQSQYRNRETNYTQNSHCISDLSFVQNAGSEDLLPVNLALFDSFLSVIPVSISTTNW
jgi:hypothetical protein